MAIAANPTLAAPRQTGASLLAAAIGLFLLAFLFAPVATVVYVAFTE